MYAKTGGRVLTCLLYGQALFGLVAVAAVMMKDPQSPREAVAASQRASAAAGTEKAAL